MIFEAYQSREKRDARARELIKQGHRVRRSSLSNQQLHPMYVVDFEGPEKKQTGLGNTVYNTFFAKLYMVETR
jgi:hypothetical protein